VSALTPTSCCNRSRTPAGSSNDVDKFATQSVGAANGRPQKITCGDALNVTSAIVLFGNMPDPKYNFTLS
jgi:hypothetical protein